MKLIISSFLRKIGSFLAWFLLFFIIGLFFKKCDVNAVGPTGSNWFQNYGNFFKANYPTWVDTNSNVVINSVSVSSESEWNVRYTMQSTTSSQDFILNYEIGTIPAGNTISIDGYVAVPTNNYAWLHLTFTDTDMSTLLVNRYDPFDGSSGNSPYIVYQWSKVFNTTDDINTISIPFHTDLSSFAIIPLRININYVPNSTNIDNQLSNINSNTQQTNEELSNMNSNLTNSDTSDANSNFNNFMSNQDESEHDAKIADLMLIPVDILKTIYNANTDTCPNISFTLFGRSISFPCFKISDFLGTELTNVISGIICFCMGFSLIKMIIGIFLDFKDLNIDTASYLYPSRGRDRI